MSTNKYYLVKAIYDWCQDSGLPPQIVVDVGFYGVKIPKNHVHEGTMVLNISAKATKNFTLTCDQVAFYANFNQKIENIVIPIDAICAIYALENGEGITFDMDDDEGDGSSSVSPGLDHGMMAVSCSDNDDIMINKQVPVLTIIK